MAKYPFCAECALFKPLDKEYNLGILMIVGVDQPAHQKYLDRTNSQDLKVFRGQRGCSWLGECFGSQVCQRLKEFIPRK